MTLPPTSCASSTHRPLRDGNDPVAHRGREAVRLELVPAPVRGEEFGQRRRGRVVRGGVGGGGGGAEEDGW